jgi:hypothetical protein
VQTLSITVIELTVIVEEAAEPVLFMASELVDMDGDSVPVTSTRWPR